MWIKTMPQVGIPRLRKQHVISKNSIVKLVCSNGNTAHCQQILMVQFLKGQQIFRSFHVNEILMSVYMYVQIMEQQINSVEQKQQNCQMRFLRKWSVTQDVVNRTFHNVFTQ